MHVVLPTLLLFSLIAQAQAPAPPPFVRAIGNATVPVKPDKATIQFSVVTTASTAQDAAIQNANVVTAVLAALGTLLGPNPNIQTLSYSLNPNYSFPQNGQPSRAQALKLATGQAKANADAMASGLGQHTGAAIAIQQGGTSTPTPVLLG